MKRIFFISLSCLFISTFFSQQTALWVEMMQDPNANFYDIQEAFYSYWDGRAQEKGKGYKVFKRWEHYMKPRVYPTGNINVTSQSYTNFLQWERDYNLQMKSSSGNWQAVGPIGASEYGGAGRLNFVKIHPNNPNTLFVGAPDGGVWKTTNGGNSWTPMTDQLTVIGCSDLEIDPTNPQVMYLATGDSDGGDCNSIGILKTTDGGQTWNPTGLDWSVNQSRRIAKVKLVPGNNQMLIAATSFGIWKSSNAGATWTSVRTGSFKDLEFKPGDPSIMYASGQNFVKSSNYGDTWAQVNTGLPSSNVSRMAITVTPANPELLYLLSGGDDNGLEGIYKSTNSGTSFSQIANSNPNYLGWSANGNDSGGQAWYDLCIAASPSDENVCVIGGVNKWITRNGGNSWSICSHWTGNNAPYVHADHHDLVFPAANIIYNCNDGGLYKSTDNGANWTDISGNLTIAQQYRIGISTTVDQLIIAGHQDNGTNRYNGVWQEVYGGDGMDCFIDRTNPNVIVGSYVYGDYYRSNDGGNSFYGIADLPAGEWLSVIHQDPVNANRYYAGGRQELYISNDNGSSWSSMGTPLGGGSILEFAIAPSNNQVIYTVKDNKVSKSTNGGSTWQDVSFGLPMSFASSTNVAVSNTDANVVFITFSGYTANSKVYKSTNGGSTWTNISAGIPNVPCNSIVYHNNSSNQGVYVGTDVGVYYYNNDFSEFLFFSNGLPRVNVSDLEIYYPTGKLRAGTYGRGTWESDLFSPGQAPVASYTVSSNAVCTNEEVVFTNTSQFFPTSYEWSFPGGTPSQSTLENPSVSYQTSGNYDVQLIVSNDLGSDTISLTQQINVSRGGDLPFNEGFMNANFPYPNWNVVNENNVTSWARVDGIGVAPTETNSIMFDNFANDERGTNDYIDLPSLNFATNENVQLSFDVAYAPYDATYKDSLEVLISTNCGQTFTRIYLKGNLDLATAPASTNLFTPLTTQWRNEQIDLNAFTGENVIIRFKNISGYGNRVFVDNININGNLLAEPVLQFSENQSTQCQYQTIEFTNTTLNNFTSQKWIFEGGSPSVSYEANPVITYNSSGSFDVSLIVFSAFGADTLTQSNFVTIQNSPSVPTISSSNGNVVCAGQLVTLTSSSSTDNLWSTGEVSQSISVNTGGTYSVSVSNGTCSTSSSDFQLTVNQVPDAPVITANGSTTFCQGNNVVVVSNSNVGNTWSSGQTSQQVFINQSIDSLYSTVTQNGCSSPISNVITIIANPLPTVSLANFANVCDTNAAYILSGGTPIGGNYAGSNVSNNIFNAENAGVGTYTISYLYQDTNGCSATVQKSLTVVTCSTASMNQINEEEVLVYPNPTTGLITITGDDLTKFTSYIVYEQNGKLVFSEKLENKSEKIELDFSKQKEGVYYLKLVGNTIVLKKIELVK